MKIKLLLASFASAVFLTAAEQFDSPYGMCAHFCKGEQWKLADPKFKVMKPAGIHWVRNGLTWSEAEKAPGKWDYSTLDKAVAAVKKHNMNYLPILGYDVPWGHPVSKHLDLWSDYVRRTVTRYKDQFTYWEIWNEPNINVPPNKSKLTPKQYTELLKITSGIIRSIDPKLKIVFGGTSGIPVPYIKECLDLGAGAYFDVMNIHPYADNYREPETVLPSIQKLNDLWAKYKMKQPIWVTEFSWPTNFFPHPVSREYLAKALSYFNLDPEKSCIAVVRNPDLEAIRKTEDFTLKYFRNRKEISYQDIRNLDVKKYPLLIASLTQAFPREYFKDVVSYVKRGGVIIHCFGLPFYCDAKKDENGVWQQLSNKQDKSMMKTLHIHYLTSWNDKVPSGGRIVPAPGMNLPNVKVYGSERYLSTKNLAEGDRFFPLYIQKNKEFSAPVAGVYKFNSELKGGIIVDVMFYINGVSQKTQGEYLARGYIEFLAYGMQKIFWYKFRAEERSNENCGWHFGIVHRDYSPREAYTAYAFLAAKMCPAGSTRPVLTHKDFLWHAVWRRPDKTKVHAYWGSDIRDTLPVKIPFTPKAVYSHLGQELPVKDNVISAGSGVIFVVER